jgi:hypothetical protein
LNFFAALYLSHDMFEDVDDDKWEILPWALGRNWKANLREFIKTKNQVKVGQKIGSKLDQKLGQKLGRN